MTKIIFHRELSFLPQKDDSNKLFYDTYTRILKQIIGL